MPLEAHYKPLISGTFTSEACPAWAATPAREVRTETPDPLKSIVLAEQVPPPFHA
ncbi:hypothetical protein [Actinocrispum sp. NPDC049592]|uniref:hypothetical protein n=1 Tax=Actinocrispum sp. NPDC049592 TaxID=3154835 RepID=UPI0034255DE6